MPYDVNETEDNLELKDVSAAERYEDPTSPEVDQPHNPVQLNSRDLDKSSRDAQIEKVPDVTTEQTQLQVPAEQPIQPVAATAQDPKSASLNTPGVLILQWLTYAFWGWTLVALYWLTSLSVQYFVSNSSETDSYAASYLNDMLAYSLAAVVVLFIISIICDVIYSRFEPRRKSGAAMVIMIIHAVIFALCGIGSLIAAVFAVVNMLISGQNEAASTTLISAAIMTVLYAATLVRTLHPEKVKNVTKLFWLVMLIATIAIGSLGIFGPVAYAQRTKNDRAIEAALPSIATAVNDYTNENGKLPSSLKDSRLLQSYSIDSDEEAKRLIRDNKVKYIAKEKLEAPTDDSYSQSSFDISMEKYPLESETSVYHYQLCVTYDAEKQGSYDYGYDAPSGEAEFETTPETSSHSAGEVCYDLQTDYIY